MDARSQQQIDPLWSLVDPLSVRQVAALVAGVDPNHVGPDDHVYGSSSIESSDLTASYQTVLAAIRQAVIAGSLRAMIRRTAWERGWDEEAAEGERITKDVTVLESDAGDEWSERSLSAKRRSIIYRVEPDWSLTTVTRADLVAWLRSRGRTSGFFFPEGARADAIPGYLDPTHPRYASKLAAAVRAWQAVDNPGRQTPKQALLGWLHEHAAGYGLSDKAIGEIAKIANWEPDGGAPKTPEE